MIITKKHYNEIQRDRNDLKKELTEVRRENEKLKYLNDSLKSEDLNKKLNNYKYVILVDNDYRVALYNERRFENFTSLSFETEPGYLPRITIRK